ncbi:MAG: aldo/keto reductase [Acidobacteriota bacterium]|jgi:aryl-alcohol dehydrogenase-like predicted oxidoreductase
MKYRTLGRTGLRVSSIGFGTWAVGGNMWGPQNDKDTMDAFYRAWDLGCNFFDTAEVYGDGHSETLIGRFMQESGHEPVVATKVPPLNYQWPARRGTPLREAFPVDHIIRTTENSLRRLGRDHVELQQLHVWADEWTAQDDWYEAFTKLREQGKVLHFGISINSFEPASALAVVKSGRVDAIQVVHNIFEQAPEDELFPAAIEQGVGIIDRVPFDESALTGKLTRDHVFDSNDFRSRYFSGDRLVRTVERVEALGWLVPDYAGSLAEAALRYCLSHDAVSTVIPGMRNIQQVEADLAPADLGPLGEDALKKLKDHRWDRER